MKRLLDLLQLKYTAGG